MTEGFALTWGFPVPYLLTQLRNTKAAAVGRDRKQPRTFHNKAVLKALGFPTQNMFERRDANRQQLLLAPVIWSIVEVLMAFWKELCIFFPAEVPWDLDTQ